VKRFIAANASTVGGSGEEVPMVTAVTSITISVACSAYFWWLALRD